jgi:hypothetical protein
MNLTAKQLRFVDEYLLDGNGTRAAVAAGYGLAGARVRAHRLTKDNEAVMAEIAARQGIDSQRLQIGRHEVIAGLQEAFLMARELREPAAMVSAARELGRLMGFYEPQRHALQVSAMADAEPMLRRLHTMSDAELSALAAPEAAA